MSEASKLDLRAPSESYLRFLKLGEAQPLPAVPLADFFSITDASGLKFWADPKSALASVVAAHFAHHPQLKNKIFRYAGPRNSDLENSLKKSILDLQIERLGSDPEEMLAMKSSGGAFFLLHSPNPIDSTFWSRELLGRVAGHFMAHPESYVLVDESLSSLYWDAGEDVGTLRHANETRTGTLISLEPWSQGATSLTLVNRCPKNTTGALAPLDPSMKDWIFLHQLWTREFHIGAQHLRLRTALARNTRTFTEELREPIKNGLVQCTHWPKAGHSVLLRLPRVRPFDALKKLSALGILARAEIADIPDATDLQIVIPLSGQKTREAAKLIAAFLSPES